MIERWRWRLARADSTCSACDPDNCRPPLPAKLVSGQWVYWRWLQPIQSGGYIAGCCRAPLDTSTRRFRVFDYTQRSVPNRAFRIALGWVLAAQAAWLVSTYYMNCGAAAAASAGVRITPCEPNVFDVLGSILQRFI